MRHSGADPEFVEDEDRGGQTLNQVQGDGSSLGGGIGRSLRKLAV